MRNFPLKILGISFLLQALDPNTMGKHQLRIQRPKKKLCILTSTQFAQKIGN